MSSEAFIDSFFPLYLEFPVHELVYAPIADYLHRPESKSNPVACKKVIELLRVTAAEFHLPIAILLADKLLSLVNELVLLNAEYATMFDPVVPAVMRGFLKLPDLDITPTFVSNCIAFLVSTGDSHQVSGVEVSAISSVIRRIWATDPPHSLFLQLVQWSAGSSAATPEQPFELREPKALLLVLKIFDKSSLLKDILTVIRDLVNFSPQNREKMHAHGIDSALLEIIGGLRNNDEIDQSVVNQAFGLFSVIANSISSVSVVQKFISLFCAIDGEYLPPFHMSTIMTLSTLISMNDKMRNLVPLDDYWVFEVTELKGDMIESGCTFIFSFFVAYAMPGYEVSLINLIDAKHQSVAITVTWNALRIYFGSETSEIELVLPSKQISFLAVSFQRDADATQLKTTVTTSDGVISEFPTAVGKFSPTLMRCLLGGVCAGSVVPPHPTLLAWAGLFRLLNPSQRRS
jgi:hypothetical protein